MRFRCVPLALALLCLTSADAFADAFDRVIESGKIRCAYLVYAPYVIKDEKTGSFSGIFPDIVEAVAKNANLKVEWAEDVGYDAIAPGLEAGRFDAFCGGLWPNTSRARSMSFSVPIFYSAVTAWGRVGDARFKNDLSLINDPKIVISAVDGAQEDIIARTDFPLAQKLSLPTNAPFSDNYINITTGKADVSFFENSGVREFIANNPNTLEQISPAPLRIFGNSVVFKKGDVKLKELFDQGLQELLYSGQIKKIVDKYQKYPGSFLLPSMPYETPK